MHCDETTVHIQERHCFDYVNKYGEVEPKQEKALALMGIPLPQPDKPPGRYNNRKITFDAMNRLMLIEIAKAHGLDIEEQVKYGGKTHLEKLDYIIAKQLETIRNQQKQLPVQNQQIQALTAQIAEKDAELDKKLFRIRRELSVFAAYYEQLAALYAVLSEETEEGAPHVSRLFDHLTGRAQRLLSATEQEKEYALQLREMHQTQLDMRQNQIM